MHLRATTMKDCPA